VQLKANSLFIGKAFIQMISERAFGYCCCMPSQPMATSIVLLPLRSVGYLAKLRIFIVELKQFHCWKENSWGKSKIGSAINKTYKLSFLQTIIIYLRSNASLQISSIRVSGISMFFMNL